MYQLFFRTTNLLVLLYPVVFIKIMTYSLSIHFFNQFLVYELQSSQRTPAYIFDRILDMVYELNGRKNICIFENVTTLQKFLRIDTSGQN